MSSPAGEVEDERRHGSSVLQDDAALLRRWSELDPIFIVGRQRTGTSILWRALRTAKCYGYAEGQLWLELVRPFCRIYDRSYAPDLRQDVFTLGSGRHDDLERRVALTIDGFHRRHHPRDTHRWVDKSPGVTAIRLSPMLAKLFPKAQFLFTYRNPITTIHSAERYVASHDELPPVGYDPGTAGFFGATCRHWVEAMQSWRYVRPLLSGRFMEIAQEHIASQPQRVAQEMEDFLSLPGAAGGIADTFRGNRENTAFPDREVGDYKYRVSWDQARRDAMAEICGAEASRWGYSLDFDRPGGPELTSDEVDDSGAPDFEAYCHWAEVVGNERARLLTIELENCLELVDQVAQGRVIRILNRLDPLFRRLHLR